ncbi:MAG TPA: HAD family hydrolase [Defluviitaleaceae bacterium]|nr:HAD family hydrolase [Candidatus Epulonipiscium sp.]HOQ16762.1 HAD family hydrolase [Defluviitaleaceae bacterium]HPT75720.1 HAD family hydrolase [Defluviitaleaceae bacterium]HQD50232.1 HAD family hydrolase [Defluviitaleaceae bacterium]
MCLNTILFDLDGTLLPLDMDTFMNVYFEEVGKLFRDIVNPKELITNIWKATEEMMRNTEYKTNEEVFTEAFEKYMGRDIRIFINRLNDFYDKEFMRVRKATGDSPFIRKAVYLLKDKGYDIVVATNPLFPKKAIVHRIRWAGFLPEDFRYITCYEESHYCKPNIKFYEEVLEKINKSPKECMMVGNDVKEDLVAGKLGIKTFLIEDYIVDKKECDFLPTYRGRYEDFYKFVYELPEIS